ncbi:MAG: hypothetical protein R8M45_12410, partial [Ghiorsea sp.]
MFFSAAALKGVQANPSRATQVPDARLDFAARIPQIHHDIDFRVVVEDIKQSIEGSQSPAHDAKALTSCAMLVAQASSQHAFQRDQLNVWQKKNYARQL